MNYNYIFLSLFFKIFCGYICVILSVDSSQRNIFVQFIKIIIKVRYMNKILPAGWGGHAVILSCCTMGNLTPDIFAKIRQPLSSLH